MAFNTNNIANMTRGVLGLFGPTNKAQRKLDEEDDTDSPLLPEFQSTMTDEEIRTLTAKWVTEYDSYSKDIKEQQKSNVNYWLGKHYTDSITAGTAKRPLTDNLIFEAVETFLPIATRANPEPLVATMEGQQDDFTKIIRNALAYQAERQKLRMVLKAMTRNWILYLVGVNKITWDTQENDICTVSVLPSRLILDTNAWIGVDGTYHGDFLGEKKRATARKLTKMFPALKDVISQKCDGNLGTKLTYIEWWTQTDLFFTLGDVVLGKFKNPHWNYSGKIKRVDPETQQEYEEEVVGQNHLSHPEIPYIFLSIFNLGKRPHDETSLVYQNIPLQDAINKRYQQIDRNVDSQNNGIVLSGTYFTKEQAAEAATQLSRGNPLWVPSGNVNESYKRDNPPPLARDIFQHLQDARGELRNIFGTSGASSEGLKGQETVRGKILINQLDSSRIGGGVTEYIEQVAATHYNWWLQMMFVYYTEDHAIPVMGAKSGEEFLSLVNTDFSGRRIHCTVKEGSLVPKDPLTQRNEAMDLWSAGAIDPITLFERLDFANPYESAKELLMWQLIQKGTMPPQAMFPDFEAPQVQMGATGADQTNAVNAEEAGRAITPPAEASVDEQSKQLLGAIPV